MCVSLFKSIFCGAWVAPSVEHRTSAQVMISRSVASSPESSSVLTAQSLEPALDSASRLSVPSSAHALSLSEINIKKIIKKLKISVKKLSHLHKVYVTFLQIFYNSLNIGNDFKSMMF